MHRPLRSDEIETLLDYLDDYVKSLITAQLSIEAADTEYFNSVRAAFKTHLIVEFGQKEE